MKRLIAILLSLGMTSQSWANCACGTQNCNGGSAGAASACSASMTVSLNDIVQCVCTVSANVFPVMSNTGTATITWNVSNQGHAYDAANNQDIDISSGVVTGAGTLTPTCTYAGQSGTAIECINLTGASTTMDGATVNVNAGTGTGSNAQLSGTITTTGSNECLVGGIMDDSGAAATYTAGTISVAYAKKGTCNTVNGGQICIECGVQTTGASNTAADWTSNSATNRTIANIMAIKASAVVPSVACPSMGMLGVGCMQ